MRQEENERYEQWLQQVRKTQPILTRPDDLTQDILQKVARTPRKRKEHRKFMLCFMAYETFFYSVSSNAGTRDAVLNASPLYRRLSEWPADRNADMSLKEKSACLSEMWKARKAKQHGHKRLIHQFMSNNH